jgi:hypothetical protein
VLAALTLLEGLAHDEGCSEERKAEKLIRAELLAMDAEIVRLRKIEEERWAVVATRNAAVMRAEKAEALCAGFHVVENADVPNGEIWIYDKSKTTNKENDHD